MFERYTEPARRVLFFARYEASQLGHLGIDTEHLLLGLIRESDGFTSTIFKRQKVSFEGIVSEIQKRRPPISKLSTSVEIPFTAECKRVLQYAAEESDRLLHNHIGTEHLLLGLLREEKGLAAEILRARGLRLEAVREDIVVSLNKLAHAEAREGAGGFGVVRETFAIVAGDFPSTSLKLVGYTGPGHELHRNVLFDQIVEGLPKDPQVKVQVYNAEIAPNGYTNWHCHNGTTFFIALHGVFEAEFEEGILVRAKAGDVYSEPVGKFHRGHNPDPTTPYLCIAICLTPSDREHVTNVAERPW